MEFDREIYHKLQKDSKSSKITILFGARQVGKTYLIREFAKEFAQIHEFNFQKNKTLGDFFKSTNDPDKILEFLGIVSGKKIDLNNSLVFFDEIQDCPEALNSLKYFAEDYPKAYVVAAGSLLGIYLSQNTFPVGKVEFLNLYPLSFYEFLDAFGKKDLAEKLLSLKQENNIFHELFIEEIKKYFILGGMPKVLETFLETTNYQTAREVQENLITSYKSDFAKYSGPLDALKILSVFENMPKQLSKENHKFKFNLLKKGSRFNEFHSAIDWLEHAGLCHKLPIITHVEIPLKIHVEENMFKLYFLDVGLLGALAELPLSIFLATEDLFKTFKGAFTENFFLQEFRANRKESLYCWQGKTSEVDFLYTNEAKLMPIEVKSGESGKLKSLHFFAQKYSCFWKTRCSLHKLEIREDTHLRTIPLYLAALV